MISRTIELDIGNTQRLEAQFFGDDFILIRNNATSNIQLPLLAKYLLEYQLPFIKDIIGSEIEICIELKNTLDLIRLKKAVSAFQVKEAISKKWNLPIYFDNHHDWNLVLQKLGINKESLISYLESNVLTVKMCGFQPGFVYIGDLDPQYQLPRKETPIAQNVDMNTFSMASKYVGIYSLPSPSGWYAIGRVATPIINHTLQNPLKVGIGDIIKINSISKATYDSLINENISLEAYNGIS